MRNANIYPSPSYISWSGYNKPIVNPHNSLLAKLNVNNYNTESKKIQEVLSVNNTEIPENYDILGVDNFDVIKTEEQLKTEVAENEKRILKEFKKELEKILSNDKKSAFEIAQQIKKLVGNYSFKLSVNRLKSGFSANFKPLLFNDKIDKYFTKKTDYIKIGQTEDKRVLYTDISVESAKKEVNTLFSKYFYRLKEIAEKTSVIEEIRKSLKNEDVDSFPDNSLIKYIPKVTVVFDTNLQQGIYSKNGDLFLNTCNIPKIKIRLKENKEKWNIEEVLGILKKDYKRLYVLFKNLFRQDKNIAYMLNKFAFFLNTYQKWQTAEVVYGIQGAGKGVFAVHFIKKLVGVENFLVIGNKELRSDFNGFLEGKLFVIANEVAGDITKNNMVNDNIKSLITDDYILINQKNIKHYDTRNMFNLMFFSNAKDPVKVESSDRRFNVFKTKNKNLKNVVLEELNEKMSVYIKELDKEIDAFLPILKGTNYDSELVNEILENDYRLKLKFDTNNKFDLLRDIVLQKKETELDKFFEYLKNENELDDKIELKYDRFWDSEEKQEKYKSIYTFDISDKSLKKIKLQLMNGGFVTTDQARLLVALMYYKDIEEKEKDFKDKINKFNRYFRTVAEVKQNYKKLKIRTPLEADDLDNMNIIINDVEYFVTAKKDKLKFKKVAQKIEPLPQASPEEI